MPDRPTRLRVVGGTEFEPMPGQSVRCACGAHVGAPTPECPTCGKPIAWPYIQAKQPETKKKRAPRPRQPMKDKLTPFKCAQCSAETGVTEHSLVQIVRNPHEANGKLVAGSLWWACARCLTPVYQIRVFGDKS